MCPKLSVRLIRVACGAELAIHKDCCAGLHLRLRLTWTVPRVYRLFETAFNFALCCNLQIFTKAPKQFRGFVDDGPAKPTLIQAHNCGIADNDSQPHSRLATDRILIATVASLPALVNTDNSITIGELQALHACCVSRLAVFELSV